MKWFALKIIFLLTLALFVNYSLSEGAKITGIQNVMAPFPQSSTTLECDGKPEGVAIYEEFEIKGKTRKPYSLIPEPSPQ